MPIKRKTPAKPKASKLTALLDFDRQVLEGCSSENVLLIGIDEVGRGSWIGPVVAAAASLPSRLTEEQVQQLRDLNDSKQLTAEQRETLFHSIHSFCHVGIGEASKEEVDTLNVHHASLLAATRAYQNLAVKLSEMEKQNSFILIDGKFLLPGLPVERQRAVIKGDGQSARIAAASVVAKHFRDAMVIDLAKDFPGYGWESNKGYHSPLHRKALESLGPTKHHRANFKSVRNVQLSLLEPSAHG